jgi:hypothetical protein
MAKTSQLILAGGGAAADSLPLDEAFARLAGAGPLKNRQSMPQIKYCPGAIHSAIL